MPRITPLLWFTLSCGPLSHENELFLNPSHIWNLGSQVLQTCLNTRMCQLKFSKHSHHICYALKMTGINSLIQKLSWRLRTIPWKHRRNQRTALPSQGSCPRKRTTSWFSWLVETEGSLESFQLDDCRGSRLITMTLLSSGPLKTPSSGCGR